MSKKTLTVAKRLPPEQGTWTEYQANKSLTHCDDCGAVLWIAPDGKSLYCDALAPEHKRKEQTS